MELELTKVIVRAIVAERENGRVVGERTTEEVAFFTEEQLAIYMPTLEREIAEENARALVEEVHPEESHA